MIRQDTLKIATLIVAMILGALMYRAAHGQTSPDNVPKEPDAVEIRASTEGHLAEIEYLNHAHQGSRDGVEVYTFEHPDFGLIEVRVRITVNAGAEPPASQYEKIEVTPVTDSVVAVPPEALVPDGQGIVIQLVRPMF